MSLKPENAVSRPLCSQEIPAILRCGDIQATGEVQSYVLTGDPLDLTVQLDRVILKPGDVWIAVECVKAARGMPARARRQFLALDDNHICPAKLRQMIKNTATDDAPADYDHPRM